MSKNFFYEVFLSIFRNVMSMFDCFMQIPKHVKQKKEKNKNKHNLSLSSSSQHCPSPLSGSFLQQHLYLQFALSFQPMLSEMIKTLGDTKEWNRVI